MRIKYNGCIIESSSIDLKSFRLLHDEDADIRYVNGFSACDDYLLQDGDEVVLIKRGRKPSSETLEHLMASRHTPKVHEQMKASTVGIAGVGGLGSNAVLALARMGVGRLVIVDFDVVEPSNLNRQAYFIEHLGLLKVDAMKELVSKVNPYIVVECHHVKVDEKNAVSLFEGCDVVIEAFDDPKSKAMLVSELLTHCKMPIVAGSGMAGTLSSNTIETTRRFDRLYLVGDLVTGAKEHMGLMAPRVMVASAHQANMAVRLILGEKET
ncbi:MULTISPECIES: sulfur carrier protein ThiS adenylyltransferase ThiF [unclassified Fusibacter]|uniref:sulfur carrier protein ThiS adenylyltransferase ThiF n=1 Tax=unclassified Fusibacter TaxID=2624464 RepID=UPI0010100CF9|nr:MULTISPECIES: sulfur carrier protein ThiS adenylyltransferase ThiF [unclassified Fusibacter]MCK8059933.1 sulfur carrier protein ThiS adenylyltransferase ThiF [Fusibacter sp. A2]NPE22075.1 sulfur carrier protein ThiS adenylyltransferase ThiF [Fusibacter sp. A1]RXV60854.1 sulfur carrier protein ThiS adenylyltransferase ThiF [Fusibacter sp. A1]